MTDSAQRRAYIAAQIESIHHNLRFLEAVVTQPIGLTTDLKTLRESVLAIGAREERDRQAFSDVIERGKNPQPAGLIAAEVVSSTLQLLEILTPEVTEGLHAPWVEGAVKVLERIGLRLGEDVRRRHAENLRGGLYVIVDPEHTNGRSTVEVAQAAIDGGAAAVQLRDKVSDKAVLISDARQIADICAAKNRIFIANDDADVAQLSNATGLHVGQKDMSIADARSILSSAQLIGQSNATFEEAIASESDSADYVAVGAIYNTATKSNTRPAGLDTLRRASEVVRVPVVAIGGINKENIGAVLEAGADSVCVVTAVTMASDPKAAAAQLADMIDETR
ncbi:MAG: thiamine phosphate synthase [Chloroflexi bacterium]|nr:thiamine phosphate synthase [Chloroflexota bacterium]